MRQHSILPNLGLERQYTEIVAGVDEVGRGAIAGPIVAAAVIISPDSLISGINDSKKLTKNARDKLYLELTSRYSWAVGVVSAQEIDDTNIQLANKKACEIAIAALPISPKIILIDGNMQFTQENYRSIIKGDNISLSIAAASIIAKVTRDSMMSNLGLEHPEYSWYKNSGYGTKEHLRAINEYGLSKYHRKTFQLKSLSKQQYNQQIL